MSANEQTRRKDLTYSRTTFPLHVCGLCEDACPVDALELTQDFELASYNAPGLDLGPADARGRPYATNINAERTAGCYDGAGS